MLLCQNLLAAACLGLADLMRCTFTEPVHCAWRDRANLLMAPVAIDARKRLSGSAVITKDVMDFLSLRRSQLANLFGRTGRHGKDIPGGRMLAMGHYVTTNCLVRIRMHKIQ